MDVQTVEQQRLFKWIWSEAQKEMLSLIFLTGSWFMADWPVTALSDRVGLTLPWCFPPPGTFCSGRTPRSCSTLLSLAGWAGHVEQEMGMCVFLSWCCSLAWQCPLPHCSAWLPFKQQNVEVLIRGAQLLRPSGWGGVLGWHCGTEVLWEQVQNGAVMPSCWSDPLAFISWVSAPEQGLKSKPRLHSESVILSQPPQATWMLRNCWIYTPPCQRLLLCLSHPTDISFPGPAPQHWPQEFT